MDKLLFIPLLLLLLMMMMIFPCIPSVYSGPMPSTPLAPALYIFGDSMFDSGNNNLLPTLAKANFFPYGVNFPGGPTGRFTNGRTLVDFIAEFLGLPLPPPSLSLRSLGQESLSSGMNYASSSCGILPETGKLSGLCLSLAEQINLFQATIELKLSRDYNNPSELSSYLSKSLFAIAIGNNDYIKNYLQLVLTKNHGSYQSFTKLLISKLSLHLERLYKLGARKIVVFEIGAIGCIPSVTRTFSHKGQCVEEINQLAIQFNEQLDNLLKNLRSTLQGSDLILGHLHGIGYNAIINPSVFGLKDTRNPCCTTWANGTGPCIPGLVPCANGDEHYFWDGGHPTESVYKILGELCINDSSVCTPKSIKELVKA